MRSFSVLIQVGLTIVLLGSGAASCISPEVFPLLQLLPAFDGVALFGVLLMSLVFSGSKNKVRFTAITVLLSFVVYGMHNGPAGLVNASNEKSRDEMKLVSLNVNQFGNDTLLVNRIIELFGKNKPDVICLQEFGLYYKWPDVGSVAKDFAARTGMPYYHFDPHKDNIFGTAIFSRFPILQSKLIFNMLSHTNEAWKHQLLWKEDTIAVYNVHLQSFNWSGSASREHRLDPADVIQRQWTQCQQLLKESLLDQYSIVLGDFNAPPGSRVCEAFKDLGFQSALVSSGRGYQTSLKRIPLRIDHAFISPKLKSFDAHMSDQFPSDHKAMLFSVAR